MGYIVISREDIKISGHLIHGGTIFPALRSYLVSSLEIAGYDIDRSRDFDLKSDGLVPRAVGVWTKEGVRVVARLTDWHHARSDHGAPITLLSVQLEQHH